MSNELLIEVSNLSKVYKYKNHRIKALDDVSIKIYNNEIVAFLGPNGAGKTTLIKIILNLVKKTRGEVNIFDSFNNKLHTSSIGYQPEIVSLKTSKKVKDILMNVIEVSGFNSAEKNNELNRILSIIDIKCYLNRPANTLSKGMMTKVGLAISLVGNPSTFIFDEPTEGLDPVGRRDTLDFLHRQKNEKKTVIISSHLLSEIEKVADRFFFFKNGQILGFGNMSDFVDGADKKFTSLEDIYFSLINK